VNGLSGELGGVFEGVEGVRRALAGGGVKFRLVWTGSYFGAPWPEATIKSWTTPH
jgi:hypothetical protein